MATLTPYLHIIEMGGVDLDLVDGTNYAIARGGWAPAIAGIDSSAMGAGYTDVLEEIELNVRGSSAAQALQNLLALWRVLDQAARWSRHGSGSAVVLAYQPQGSILSSPLRAVIVERADTGQQAAPVILPRNTNDVGMIYEISGVRLRFYRQGRWIGADSVSTTSPALTNPDVLSCTFSNSADVLSPCQVTLSGLTTSISSYSASLLLLTAQASHFSILEAEGFATGVTLTSVADSANNARGGFVLRYTPTSTSAQVTPSLPISFTQSTIAVYAMVRNTSSTTFQVVVSTTSASQTVSAPATTIDTSSSAPRPLMLGILANPLGHLRLQLSITASAASGQLDIDYLVLVVIDEDRTRIIHLGATTVPAGTPPGVLVPLVIDDRTLYDEPPRVTVNNGSTPVMLLSCEGDALILSTGTEIAAVWMAPNGASWRVASGGTPITNQLSVTRHTAYLTPL